MESKSNQHQQHQQHDHKNNNSLDKFRAVIEKILLLEPNDRPKFLEQLKKLCSAEIFETQIKQKEPTTNTRTTAINIYRIQICDWKSNIKERSHISPIHLPIALINNTGKTNITNSEPNP